MVYTNTSIYRDNDRLSTNCMCVDALIIIYESTVTLLSARWPKFSTMYQQIIVDEIMKIPARITRRIPLVEQELLTLPEHLRVHPRFLVGFVLLDP